MAETLSSFGQQEDANSQVHAFFVLNIPFDYKIALFQTQTLFTLFNSFEWKFIATV